MDSDALAPVPAPAPTEVSAPIARPPVLSRHEERAGRRSAAIARLQASIPETEATPAVIAPPTPAPKSAPAAVAPEPAPDKPDPATDRGLRAIEQARKKFLDEQTSSKAELEIQRAEIARLRKDAEGKASSIDELRKLSPTELLSRLDYADDDFDILSRASYARTKAGKVDPRAQAAAQEAERSQAGRMSADKANSRVAELESQIEKLQSEFRGEFTRRDQASFAERWVGDAVKAIPSDRPTFLAKLHANEPETARRELLAIGAELEKANDGDAPTQAEVVEEFEKRKRAQLKSLGLDADALLSPPKPAPAAKPIARSLDPSAANVTRPELAPSTRAEKRVAAIANLRARQRATADQT